jgi:hypothetical protein
MGIASSEMLQHLLLLALVSISAALLTSSTLYLSRFMRATKAVLIASSEAIQVSLQGVSRCPGAHLTEQCARVK